MDAALEQRVRERAYSIWMAAGMHNESADQHWFSAVQAVMSEAGQACAKPAKPAKSFQPKKSAEPKTTAQPKKAVKNAKPAVVKTTTTRKPAKAAMTASA